MGKTGKRFSLAAGLVAMFSVICFCFFYERTETITITSHTWARRIDIETLKTVDESGWYVPADGRIRYTNEEIRSYEKVLDHYETVQERKSRQVIDRYETVVENKSRQVVDYYEEVVTGYTDLGNGYFEENTAKQPVYKTEYYTEAREEPVYATEYYYEERKEPVYRDEPVYDTKYYYEIDRWIVTDCVETSGEGKEPYWGDVFLQDKQREGKRSENYKVRYTSEKGVEEESEVCIEDWEMLEDGAEIKAKIGIQGRIKEIIRY